MEGKVSVEKKNLEEYNFPFPPYDIQLKLMKEAYDTYEKSKFSILESPTGTGKSLSLICSSLTWLRDHQNKVKHELEDRKVKLSEKTSALKKEEEISGDWLSIQTKRQDVTKELADVNVQLERINKFEEKNEARRHAKLHNVPLEIYSSMRANGVDIKKDSEIGTKDENKLLGFDESTLEEEEEDIEQNLKDTSEVDIVRPKIYYASRTHSQLSQFINEIKRTKFADINQGCTVKVAAMASRANMCVNPDVLRLKDPSAINERCLEMQRETMVDKRCSFMKGKQVKKLKEDILSSVQDIEDIVGRGRVMGSCPYYASRMAVAEAEVVVLPYNNLLHHETRKASSLDLKENIVIIDEAHNILETICSIHSATIAGQHLIGTHTVLSRYYKRYHTRMSPKNATTIKTIIECITAILKFLNAPKRHLKDYECPKQIKIECDEETHSINDINASGGGKVLAKHQEFMIDVVKFMGAANLDRFNVFKLVDYFNRSQLARKLLGFYRQDCSFELDLELKGIERRESQVEEEDAPVKKKRKLQSKQVSLANDSLAQAHSNDQESTSLSFLKSSNPILTKRESAMTSYPVYILVEFLRSLTNLTHDGKILIDQAEGDIQRSMLKFILLNPSSQFKQMVEEARSIVLAGGTMQPFDEFTSLLFGPLNIDRYRLNLFSCEHVVRPEQLFVATLSTGSTNKPLELSYKAKNDFETIDEIGRTIFIIAGVVPGGMVCFFPSYDYEQICFNRWKQVGVIANIETKSKQVFREPRQTSHLKPVLEEYCRVIEKSKNSNRGAMLMCVVGGKMSEGINFNDDLGRCIVMVGLPYANIKSSELQQKMSYYDRTCNSLTATSNSAGRQYYENLCIKGINQSIGRAIRHKMDYASIILMDRRYATKTTIKAGLPAWMSKSLKDFSKFGTMISQLRAFFDNVDTVCRQQQ